jgi:hypothetical protein
MESERDLLRRWFEAKAEEKLAQDERDSADKVLQAAQTKTTNVEQLLYDLIPEKGVRRFYLRALGKMRLVSIHRRSGSFGVDGIYEEEVEDLETPWKCSICEKYDCSTCHTSDERCPCARDGRP